MTVTSAMLETYPKDLGGIDREATGRVLSRHSGHAPMHGQGRVCAQACRRCERASRDLITTVS